MEYRALGNSNLKVPVLCLGGNIFGNFCNEKETKNIIDFAFENGINFIDTANVYSDGISEIFIGNALKGRRNKFIIATKAGLRSDQKPENIFTREYILKSVEESLQRLQTEYIDLYQVHNFDQSVPFKETMQTLNELVDVGKVKYIGCSNYTLTQLRKVISLQFKHRFISIQLPYNLIDREIELEILPLCEKEKVGVLTYHSLARGRLTGKYQNKESLPKDSRAVISASIREKITDEVIQFSNKIKKMAETKKHSATELAITWILFRKEISSVIVGVRSIEQLRDCIKAVSWKLTREEMGEIENTYSFISTPT